MIESEMEDDVMNININVNFVFKIPEIHIFIHNAEQDAEAVKRLETLGQKIDSAEAKMQQAVDDAAKK